MRDLLTTRRTARFGKNLYLWSRSVVSGSLNLLYPRQCAQCEAAPVSATEILLCDECRRRLAPADRSQCERCAAAIPSTQRGESDCSRCRSESFRFEKVFALGRYENELRQAVLRMKRRHDEPLTRAVGSLMVETLLARLRAWSPDVVLPIPMHWSRRMVRGTNSPTLLAERLAKALCVPMSNGALTRNRNTQVLREMSRKDRVRNLRDAFSIERGCDFSAARVLLIDDILTTGATCNAATKALRDAGAAAVAAAVVARAYPE